jgi:spore coat polysaccharide biosynthesis protein SpsF (cytidylyltransferase family)
MTTVAVIQARMSSSRFPGKQLAPLAGKPMIRHTLNACIKAACLDEIIVATSDQASDDPLYDYLGGDRCYRGSLSDPLERMYEAARKCNASRVVRVTADCPLVDYRLIQKAVATSSSLSYWGMTNSPDGTDVEIFPMGMLRDANLYASVKDRIHTTTWIRRKATWKTSVEGDPRYRSVHYSVNTVDDLKICERLIAKCGEHARWQDHVSAYRRIHAKSA